MRKLFMLVLLGAQGLLPAVQSPAQAPAPSSAAAQAPAPSSAAAQAPAPPVVQPVVESHYKLAPGKGEEWLALYKKWHLPILQEQRKEGRILSITIYQPQLHTGTPAWDYKVILRYASFAVMGDAAHTREITRRLYPNEEELRRNERRRWEITDRHWDDLMVEAPE